MLPDRRLAQIVAALDESKIDALVRGGHAVRYYGVDRNTSDFDFFTGAPSVIEVKRKLLASPIFSTAKEGPSWRPEDFTRFEIGRLPDGREEWLEFWLRNHLLPDFNELCKRQEIGEYGGRHIAFISLADLLRSKETEREGDWQDISLLEEIQDARNFARIDSAPLAFLTSLRSRRGFRRALDARLFQDGTLVNEAASLCVHPVTFSFLAPAAPGIRPSARLLMPIEDHYLKPLFEVPLGHPKHLGLIEIVRRAYKRLAMDRDRRDKQHRLARR